MRKLLLVFALFSLYQISSAQLTGGIKLNEQRIGSAGNLLTVDEYGCNQIDVSDSLIVFIHRNDPTVAPGTNIGQYSFDKSENGGKTFTSQIGPFTSNPPDNGYDVNGRYPQGLIYNPAGNTVLDSAWLIYNGTWHNETPSSSSGSWVGQVIGRGRISGDTSTYDTYIDTINNGVTAIATSMVQGAPGVFWTVNEDFTGTFATGSNQITQGIIVEKGVWDSTTMDVDWTDTELPQIFDSVLSDGIYYSVASAFNIAFDPTGKYGWIACLGDITTPAAADSVYNPIFWHTTDGGNTWSQAFELKLDSLPGVISNLPAYNRSGDELTLVPTTLVEGKLTVDYLGNPHFFTTVTDGGGYGDAYGYFDDAGYTAYDITYNTHAQPCDSSWNGWSAIFVDSIETLEGTYTTDAAPYTEDNRTLVSRTKDGKKIFFFWLDSDYSYWEADENNGPNLFTRGFDVAGHTSTPVFNLTENDSLFAGETTVNPNGGVFPIGANFPVISPTAMPVGNSLFNIPLVLTEIDYQNYSTGTRSGDNPAAFWYINNVNFSTGDFSNSLEVNVQVLGENPDTVRAGNLYTDAGATIVYADTSCHQTGAIFLVTDTSYVNTGSTGICYVYYNAEDSSGTVYATGVRAVVVVGPPVADFTYYASNGGLVLHFIDESTNNPTSWAWNFGDNATSNNQNQVHEYAQVGQYNVCLTASNEYGSSAQLCQLVQVDSTTGISPVNLNNNVSLYPNPSNGKVNMSIKGISSDYTIAVYDILGQQVTGTLEEKGGTTNVQLDLAFLSSGTYSVKLRSANGTAEKQVVLTHGN